MLQVSIEQHLQASQPTEYHYLNLKRNILLNAIKRAVLEPDPVGDMSTMMVMARVNPLGVIMDVISAVDSMKHLRGER